MNQNSRTFDIQKKKERMTQYFTEQKEYQDFNKPDQPIKILNPNKAPQFIEQPLINQVKHYYQSRVNKLEFTQLFEGKESFNQMFVTILLTSFQIINLGSGAIYLNYIGYTFILLILLLNGFQILGLHVFYFSKNPDKTLAYFFTVLVIQFLLLRQLWGGGLMNNIFTLCYVFFNGYRFIRQLQVSPPSTEKIFKSNSQFFCQAVKKSLKISQICRRVKNFLIFLTPVYCLILITDYYYQQQKLTLRKMVLACFVDLILQFSESLIVLFKKYYVFNLSRKVDQLPLFLYPLCLQNNQYQEIAAINYINNICNDDKIFNQKMLFRLDACQPPTIGDVVQSYFFEKLKSFVQQIQQNFQQIQKLQNEKNKVRTLFEDITLPFTLFQYYFQTYLIKIQQRSLIKYYYFIFIAFHNFQKETQYEVECLRFNV